MRSGFFNSAAVKFLALFMLFAGSFLPLAAKNILQNGDFSDGLLHWKFGSDAGAGVTPFASGGPANRPFVRLQSINGNVSLSQLYCGMPKNEKFKISCFLRVNELASDAELQLEILCLPDKHRFPMKGKVGKWVKYEKIFTSTNGGNYLSFQLKKGPGSVDIALAAIEPLAADTKSGDIMEHVSRALVPMANLHYLHGDAVVRFQYSGKFPVAENNLLAVFYVKENPRRALRLPLKNRSVYVDMRKFGSKEGTLMVSLQNGKSGQEQLSGQYPFRFVEHPQAEKAVKLNNLVTELFNAPMPDELLLKNPRYGWIFCRFIPGNPEEPFAITLNGEPLIDNKTLRHETVRLCEPGKLIFAASGAPDSPSTGSKGTLIVRTIPEIFCFPLGLNDWPGNGKFNWRFARNFMLPALTTVSAGIPTRANVLEMQSMGLKWFNNFGIFRGKGSEAILKALQENNYDQRGKADGASLDELTLSETGNPDRFAWAFRKFDKPEDKTFHVWITGVPVPANSNAFSAVINASKGHGRLLHEIYKHPQPTVEETELYWQNTRQSIINARKILGETAFRYNYSVILGLFTESPSISLNIHPQVDYKYFQEMTIRSLAMDKEFDGLGGVGFWGIHHATDESVRWGFALLKHYAVEGRTDWLCDRYGFKFLPGLLNNPDFADGLNGWEANELVRSGTFKGFGSRIQHRYAAPAGVGDSFAILSRTADAYGELSQTMSGLEPGKIYSVSCVLADHQDLQQNRHNPRRLPLELTVSGAEILKKTRVISRHPGGGEKAQNVRVNTIKIIFRAESPEVKLLFDTRKASSGEEIVINNINVTPYFYQKEKVL